MDKEKLANKILLVFQRLNVFFDTATLLSKLDTVVKLRITNEFIEVTDNNKEYLVRINGIQRPPFTRSHEAQVLTMLQVAGFHTSVLVNEAKFQICRKYSGKRRADNIVKEHPEKMNHIF